jgi:hypothetical protein
VSRATTRTTLAAAKVAGLPLGAERPLTLRGAVSDGLAGCVCLGRADLPVFSRIWALDRDALKSGTAVRLPLRRDRGTHLHIGPGADRLVHDAVALGGA